MAELRTTSERIENLSFLIYWLKQIQVDTINDRVLKPPHCNWKGLSYWRRALVFVACVVSGNTNLLSTMEVWARRHLQSLSQALGKPVRADEENDGGDWER